MRRSPCGPLLLGLAGGLGGTLHGASNLTHLLRPLTAGSDLDPNGILRYGVAGLALLVVARLIQDGRVLPKELAYLAYASGAILVFIYVGRLGNFITPDHKASLIPPFLFGFVLYPALYVWIGLEFLRSAARARGPAV